MPGKTAPLHTSFTSMVRNRERERRARTHLALDPDSSAMQLDELPRQGQPEPRALHLLCCRPHLSKLLEDRLLILGGDAHPGVGSRDLYRPVDRRGPDLDPTPLGRELDRIGEQVQDDLTDLPLVRPNLAQSLVDRHSTSDAPAG